MVDIFAWGLITLAFILFTISIVRVQREVAALRERVYELEVQLLKEKGKAEAPVAYHANNRPSWRSGRDAY